MNFEADCEIAIEALQAFKAQSLERHVPVIHQAPMKTLIERLELERLIDEGGLHGDRLDEFLDDYLEAATRLHHAGYMAHQVAVPAPLGAVAALIDGFTNNAMAIYEMGPSAAAVEFVVVNWMLKKVGWRSSPVPGSTAASEDYGGGVLTDGGSLANLTAFIAARGRVSPEAWKEGTPSDLVIVASEGCHYSIIRAAAILGLGQRAVRYAPTDNAGRLAPDRLASFIGTLRDEGAKPLAVVAKACGTDVGLYDPLYEVAAVCRALGVWLHVDGAHGASVLVSQRYRGLLKGVELADSLIWDAHKMLRTPTLCAAVLVRDHRDLDNAFCDQASYLFYEKDQPGFDFIHRTIECTKAALGLKLFFALASDGEKAISDYVDRQHDLAKAAAAFLRSEPNVEVAVEPQSNIVCFRLGDDDDYQLCLRKRLIEAGNYYISTTEFCGKRWLRLVLMNPTTELADIKALIEEIRSIEELRG